MRDRINVLYYPDMQTSENTLKKAILLFDELHFMDRPSLTFNNFGTIGIASPLRQFEETFRKNGVPLYVHGVNGGKVQGDLLDQVRSDINDLSFIKEFKEGLETSTTFRNIHIPPGNYGPSGNEKDVAEKFANTDILSELKNFESPEFLLSDNKIKPYDLTLPLGCAKQIVSQAALCSAQVNFALIEGAKKGFVPLADATPYSKLLSNRYSRAISKLNSANLPINISDLSFAIFDELIPTESVEKLSIEQVVKYRRKSENHREAFLEHLLIIQEKQASISIDDNYEDIIKKIIMTEIIPAVNAYKKKLQTIDEGFYGSMMKGALGTLGGSGTISIFADLSWEKILLLGLPVGAFILASAVDDILATRATKRECSISYLLSLDK